MAREAAPVEAIVFLGDNLPAGLTRLSAAVRENVASPYCHFTPTRRGRRALRDFCALAPSRRTVPIIAVLGNQTSGVARASRWSARASRASSATG
jgi:hypothetical protein